MNTDLVTEYLLLGLRFDRVVDGFVDAFVGDPALRKQVADEPVPDPADLSRRAVELAAAVPDAGLAADRSAFLTAHLDALAVAGRRLAGAELSFIDEVRSYFQVEITMVDTGVYEQSHAEISALIGGSGSLPDRLAATRATESCPPDLVETAVRAMAAALRERVADRAGLPGAEHIEFDIERDVAWSGFNYYLGDFASRVAVNADVGHRMSQIPPLVAHECYPGHHTEHCRKEQLLVRESGQLEQTIFLVNTPQCLMAEGLGDLALTAAVGPGWARWSAEVLDGIGPRFDPELAEALELASRPLNTVRQNAAILLHDRAAPADEVLAYLRKWGLVDERRAQQAFRFITDPLWRAYTSTYVEGERLLRPWLEARPPGQDAFEPSERAWARFQRLLDEPLIPSVIQAELGALHAAQA